MPKSKFSVDNRSFTIILDNSEPCIATKLTGEESISMGSAFVVDFASNTVLTKALLGKPACAIFEDRIEFFFNGVITELEYFEYSESKMLHYYQVKIQDPLSLLNFRTTRQIFQNKNTKEILETLFSDLNIKNFVKFSVSGSGKIHEYCAQMDETHLDFAKRLIAFEGWYYFTDRRSKQLSVIITDSNQHFIPAQKETYYFNNQQNDPDAVLTSWTLQENLGINKMSLADFSENLGEVLESGERKSKIINGSVEQSYYKYGQGVEKKSDLRELAKIQMEAFDTQKQLAQSNSSYPSLSVGQKFRLAEHNITAFNQEYFVVFIRHHLEHDDVEFQYENRFHCLPNSLPYHPLPIAKPAVNGIHSATVTGPKAQEIYKDAFGRIKVQFHWDRNGKNDENTSCWLPVTQNIASRGFGMQFLPRVGDEVLVQYIDGNPDRPVIIGSIYNKLNTPPYTSGTQSGIKTRSLPGGGSKDGNELRFEDQRSNEHIFLQAQKDLMVNVKNNSTTTVTGKLTSSTQKETELNSKENFVINSDKNLQTNTKASTVLTSDATIQLLASTRIDTIAGGAMLIDGQSISINGKTSIELSVGSSRIQITPLGVEISGPTIKISGNSTVNIRGMMTVVEGQGKLDLKSAMVTVDGSVMAMIKSGVMVKIQGAITMVN